MSIIKSKSYIASINSHNTVHKHFIFLLVELSFRYPPRADPRRQPNKINGLNHFSYHIQSTYKIIYSNHVSNSNLFSRFSSQLKHHLRQQPQTYSIATTYSNNHFSHHFQSIYKSFSSNHFTSSKLCLGRLSTWIHASTFCSRIHLSTSS